MCVPPPLKGFALAFSHLRRRRTREGGLNPPSPIPHGSRQPIERGGASSDSASPHREQFWVCLSQDQTGGIGGRTDPFSCRFWDPPCKPTDSITSCVVPLRMALSLSLDSSSFACNIIWSSHLVPLYKGSLIANRNI